VLIGYSEAVVQGLLVADARSIGCAGKKGFQFSGRDERGDAHLVQRRSGKQRVHHSRMLALVMSVIGAFPLAHYRA